MIGKVSNSGGFARAAAAPSVFTRPASTRTDKDRFLGPQTELPRASTNDSKSELSWGARAAIVAGLGIPAVGAVMLGAMATSTSADASEAVPTDLANEVLFGNVEASDTTLTPEVTPEALPELDENEQLLKDKLVEFSEREFAGDYDAVFEHFDSDNDGLIDPSELSSALKKIKVGNFLTRDAWVDGIMERMDNSPQDGKLSFNELLNRLD